MLTLSLREKATLGFHACGSCPKEKTLRDSSAPRASKCATHLPPAMRICGWYVNQLSPIGSFPTSSFLPYLIGPFSIFPDWFISQSLTPLAKLCNPAHRLPYLNPCSPWFSGSSSLGPFEEAERVLRTLPTKTPSLLLRRPEGSQLSWNHWAEVESLGGCRCVCGTRCVLFRMLLWGCCGTDHHDSPQQCSFPEPLRGKQLKHGPGSFPIFSYQSQWPQLLVHCLTFSVITP